MNSLNINLVKNPRYYADQRKAFFDGIKSLDDRESVPLDKLEFAVDKNGDGRITSDEGLQDAAEIKGSWKGDSPEVPLYLRKKQGFFGKLFGKEAAFQKASGWIEVPDSGPVRYDTRMLDSIDTKNQTAEIATVFTIPFLRDPLYIRS